MVNVSLRIGNPPQFVRVLISTTCPQPWAVDPLGCTPQDPVNCASNRGGFFNNNHSTTWQQQGFYELDQEQNLGYTGNGDFGLDSITLGYPGSGSSAITVDNQLLATIAAKDFYVATWGIAPRPTNLTKLNPHETKFAPKDSYQSLLSVLKERNEIPSLSYGYTAGARYRLKRVPASLTLGGYDASRFVPSNLTFGLAGDNSRDLVVGIQSISVGRSNQLLPKPILAFIDSTIPQIWLPLEACQVFETVFGISWDPSSDLYLVNETTHEDLLIQNASLTFTIGSNTVTPNVINITLPYASFDLQVLDTYPNVTNSTRYFPLRRAANDTQYTLGRAFLQETFSIHQCRFDEDVTADIHPILPTDITVVTNGTNTSSDSKKGRGGLSPGIIAAIAVASLISLVILITFLTYLWWRKKKDNVLDLGKSDEPPIAPVSITLEDEQELHAEPIQPPELHNVPLRRPELEGGVAATEMHPTDGERY
ncbi:MAG: hypothetical protein Q9213_004038 [Squamulea squamosa]